MHYSKKFIFNVFNLAIGCFISLSYADGKLDVPLKYEEKDNTVSDYKIYHAEVVKRHRLRNIEYSKYVDIRMLPTELSNAKTFGIATSNNKLIGNCNTVETGNEAAFKLIIVNENNHTFPIKTRATWMPENPGNISDSTIMGIDADNDCVRDDIERYIGKKYPRKDQQRQRKYLFQYAMWLGIFLKRSDWSIFTIRSISTNISKSAECVRRIHGIKGKVNQLLDDIFAEFHNTFPRSLRYIKNRGMLGGWAPREKLSVSCS